MLRNILFIVAIFSCHFLYSTANNKADSTGFYILNQRIPAHFQKWNATQNEGCSAAEVDVPFRDTVVKGKEIPVPVYTENCCITEIDPVTLTETYVPYICKDSVIYLDTYYGETLTMLDSIYMDKICFYKTSLIEPCAYTYWVITDNSAVNLTTVVGGASEVGFCYTFKKEEVRKIILGGFYWKNPKTHHLDWISCGYIFNIQKKN